MNVEDPKTIQDAIDQASRNFGGIMNETMTRLEVIADTFAKLLERVDGGMIMFKLGDPK